MFSGNIFTAIIDGNAYDFIIDRLISNGKHFAVYWEGDVLQNENYLVSRVDEVHCLALTLIPNKEISSNWMDFIESVKTKSKSNNSSYLILDKDYLTLMTTLKEVKNNANDTNYWYKADVKIDTKIKAKEIAEMFNYTLKYFFWRLKIDSIERILTLMKCYKLIERMKELGIVFLFKDVEIRPKLIYGTKAVRKFSNFILKKSEKKRLEMSLK